MTTSPKKQIIKKVSPRTSPNQRALVVGISGYPASIGKLPAVAADVRAMASLLGSKSGIFASSGVNAITEKQAIKTNILAALRKTFNGAKATETIFVYLAGHGAVEGNDYYFVPYDADIKSLSETAVSLAEIKQLFDRTACQRVFLWLDFCHSGGILSRGTRVNDLAEIKRSIGVVSGQGKIIVAACTSTQLAYEDNKGIGHGFFTHALLRGLKGEAKSVQGEVTAFSLYEFIDHQLKDPKQSPMFFGETTGRIVLMHYADRVVVPSAGVSKVTKAVATPKAPTVGAITASGNLILLDGKTYTALSVAEKSDGNFDIQVVPKTSEEDAALRGLRGDRFSRAQKISFAYKNLGFNGQIGEVSSHTSGAKTIWTINYKPTDSNNNTLSDMSYNGLSVQELASMRVQLMLLGETPESRGSGNDMMLIHYVQGPMRELGLTESVFATLWRKQSTPSSDFLQKARLWAIYYLRVSGVCDDVLELKLGPVRAGKMTVRFRGRRKSRYSNGEAQEILISGACLLNEHS